MFYSGLWLQISWFFPWSVIRSGRGSLGAHPLPAGGLLESLQDSLQRANIYKITPLESPWAPLCLPLSDGLLLLLTCALSLSLSISLSSSSNPPSPLACLLDPSLLPFSSSSGSEPGRWGRPHRRLHLSRLNGHWCAWLQSLLGLLGDVARGSRGFRGPGRTLWMLSHPGGDQRLSTESCTGRVEWGDL